MRPSPPPPGATPTGNPFAPTILTVLGKLGLELERNDHALFPADQVTPLIFGNVYAWESADAITGRDVAFRRSFGGSNMY